VTSGRDFNDTIRAAAGCVPAVPAHRPVAHLGIGRGSSKSILRQHEPTPSMSSMIRAARALRNEEVLARARSYEVSDG
jgi:hypothetical protein